MVSFLKEAAWWLAWLYAAWLWAHLAMMALSRPDYAAFNGFWIIIPDRYHDLLTREELYAVWLHERGHRERGHVWKNFARLCVFRSTSQEVRQMQEIEADDYAVTRGWRMELASALEKFGATQGFDQFRILRLRDDFLWMQQEGTACNEQATQATGVAAQ